MTLPANRPDGPTPLWRYEHANQTVTQDLPEPAKPSKTFGHALSGVATILAVAGLLALVTIPAAMFHPALLLLLVAAVAAAIPANRLIKSASTPTPAIEVPLHPDHPVVWLLQRRPGHRLTNTLTQSVVEGRAPTAQLTNLIIDTWVESDRLDGPIRYDIQAAILDLAADPPATPAGQKTAARALNRKRHQMRRLFEAQGQVEASRVDGKFDRSRSLLQAEIAAHGLPETEPTPTGPQSILDRFANYIIWKSQTSPKR